MSGADMCFQTAVRWNYTTRICRCMPELALHFSCVSDPDVDPQFPNRASPLSPCAQPTPKLFGCSTRRRFVFALMLMRKCFLAGREDVAWPYADIPYASHPWDGAGFDFANCKVLRCALPQIPRSFHPNTSTLSLAKDSILDHGSGHCHTSAKWRVDWMWPQDNRTWDELSDVFGEDGPSPGFVTGGEPTCVTALPILRGLESRCEGLGFRVSV